MAGPGRCGGLPQRPLGDSDCEGRGETQGKTAQEVAATGGRGCLRTGGLPVYCVLLRLVGGVFEAAPRHKKRSRDGVHAALGVFLLTDLIYHAVLSIVRHFLGRPLAFGRLF